MNNLTLENATKASAQTCKPSKDMDTDVRVVTFSLIIAISIIGNILIIIVVAFNKRMHTVTNYLICNMSIADLLITFLPMTWEVIKLSHFADETWPMGRFMCSFVHMCTYLSVACSILSLTAITCDRFFAIIFPMKVFITKRLLPVLLLVIWVTSLAFASPTIYAQKLVVDNGKKYCLEIWKAPFHAENSPVHYTVILFVGLYALPLALMAVMYSAIAWRIWSSKVPGTKTSTSEQNIMKRNIKVTKMVVTIVCVFTICWLPVFVVQFMFFTSQYYQRCPIAFPAWLSFFAFSLQYLGSAMNPYIYFIFSGSYYTGLKNMFSLKTRTIETMPRYNAKNGEKIKGNKVQPENK